MNKLTALLALAMLPLLARPQEAAKPKAPISMAGKHEISFNLRNLSFTEVNNSILGLAYRYHWNEKWNLRVQGDVGLIYNQRLGDYVGPDTGQSGFSYRSQNTYNYAFLIGVEKKVLIGPGHLLIGVNLGFGVVGFDVVRYDNVTFSSTDSQELEIISRQRFLRYRLRPSLGYRWQFHKNISATIETQLNIEYEAFETTFPGSTQRLATSYNLNISSIPISSLTFNVHF